MCLTLMAEMLCMPVNKAVSEPGGYGVFWIFILQFETVPCHVAQAGLKSFNPPVDTPRC